MNLNRICYYDQAIWLLASDNILYRQLWDIFSYQISCFSLHMGAINSSIESCWCISPNSTLSISNLILIEWGSEKRPWHGTHVRASHFTHLHASARICTHLHALARIRTHLKLSYIPNKRQCSVIIILFLCLVDYFWYSMQLYLQAWPAKTIVSIMGVNLFNVRV